VQTLTRTQNQVTNLSVPEERGFLLERTAAPHTCSGPPQSSAEQFGVETPHRIKLSPHVCGLQLKASPFKAGMEEKAYKLLLILSLLPLSLSGMRVRRPQTWSAQTDGGISDRPDCPADVAPNRCGEPPALQGGRSEGYLSLLKHY
jgi:hypothetical protein